jgi:acetolactate synthase I/II/III large subunit
MLLYEEIVRALRANDVSHVFGVMGNANYPWIAHGAGNGAFEYIAVRHEAAAVNAAAGYARATGRVGVATTTHGPGVTNAVTALIAAVRDHAPVVLIAGEVSPDDPDNSQLADQRTILAGTGCGYLETRTPEVLPAAVTRAMAIARADGVPQVVSVRTDFLEREIESASVGAFVDFQAAPGGRTPSDESLDRAVDCLAASERPVILAGQGAVNASARAELEALGELSGAVFAESLLARHFFHGSPYSLGLSGGLASPQAKKVLAQADCLVSFGAALNKYTTTDFTLFRAAKVVQCDNRAAPIGRLQPVDVGLIADARLAAAAMVERWNERGLGSRSRTRWTDQTAELAVAEEQTSADSVLSAATVYRWLEHALPADRVVVAEGGWVSSSLHQTLTAPDARSYLWSSGFGSIGHGLQTAIGASVARPDQLTLCIAGDGGFLMSPQELDTAVRIGARMLVVVMNDSQYGMESRHLRAHGFPVDVSRFVTPDLGALARGYGAVGIQVTEYAELPEIAKAIARDSWPIVVDVRLDPEQALG